LRFGPSDAPSSFRPRELQRFKDARVERQAASAPRSANRGFENVVRIARGRECPSGKLRCDLKGRPRGQGTILKPQESAGRPDLKAVVPTPLRTLKAFSRAAAQEVTSHSPGKCRLTPARRLVLLRLLLRLLLALLRGLLLLLGCHHILLFGQFPRSTTRKAPLPLRRTITGFVCPALWRSARWIRRRRKATCSHDLTEREVTSPQHHRHLGHEDPSVEGGEEEDSFVVARSKSRELSLSALFLICCVVFAPVFSSREAFQLSLSRASCSHDRSNDARTSIDHHDHVA
jgi:hypothetical protein